jgi:hypothetical protein
MHKTNTRLCFATIYKLEVHGPFKLSSSASTGLFFCLCSQRLCITVLIYANNIALLHCSKLNTISGVGRSVSSNSKRHNISDNALLMPAGLALAGFRS